MSHNDHTHTHTHTHTYVYIPTIYIHKYNNDKISNDDSRDKTLYHSILDI
jgi:hypothetical protein